MCTQAHLCLHVWGSPNRKVLLAKLEKSGLAFGRGSTNQLQQYFKKQEN